MLTGGKYTESNKLSGMCYQRETCKRWFFLLVFTFTSVFLAQNCYTWGLFESHIIGCKLRSIFVLMVIGNHGIILGYVSLLFSLDAFVIYCDIVLCISYVIVLWRFPFVNLRSVSVGFYTQKTRFTVRFRFLRFQILIMCRANTNDTGENTSIEAVQNSDLPHSGCSRCNGELIIIGMLQVATWYNICCWLDLYM